MKYIEHTFKTPSGFIVRDNTMLFSTDICCYCNLTVNDIVPYFFKQEVKITQNYINKNNIRYNSFIKCITEDEFLIKQILE